MSKNFTQRKSPNTAELADIYAELFKLPNVRCCYVGRKAKGGARTDEIAIVCGVSSKIGKKKLPASHVIPPRVPWLKHASRPRKIRTDVVELSGAFVLQQGGILGPGDTVTRKSPRISATVGIAMRHPELGPVITTAGHLFGKSAPNEDVELQSGNQSVHGILKKCVRDNRADYALIQVDEPYKAGNLFRDIYPLGPLHFPAEEDLHSALSVLTANEILGVRCEGIHGRFDDGEFHLTDLILTTYNTHGGDSGACLVGKNNRIWGLLVGAVGTGSDAFSAFLPAFVPLGRENADLL